MDDCASRTKPPLFVVSLDPHAYTTSRARRWPSPERTSLTPAHSLLCYGWDYS